MNRILTTCVALALTVAGVAGCNSDAYTPEANEAKLASYATMAKYPAGMPSTPATDISWSVGGNGVITLRNASDGALGMFDLWVNKLYVIQVNKLSAKSKITIAPELIYNNNGVNLTTVKPESMVLVQISQPGKLMDVAGPTPD